MIHHGDIVRLALTLALLLTMPALAGCGPRPTVAPGSSLPAATDFHTGEAPQRFSYEVVNAFPHDANAFTQGLVYADGMLYESTGLLGASSLRAVHLETGEVENMVVLPADIFGEGLVLLGNRLIQLTWQSRVAYVYDRAELRLIGAHHYETEGWGITSDGTDLVMSDGTATLCFRDAESFAPNRYVTVSGNGVPLTGINELEFINGLIYANVWRTDFIALIQPTDGQVLGWIDLSGLLATQEAGGQVDVLNGIAYDVVGDRLFVTGKLWPWLFELRIVPAR